MNDTESIRFECDHCKKRLRVGIKSAGKRVRCPKCTKVVDVPVQSSGEKKTFARNARRLSWGWFGGAGGALVLLAGLGVWLIPGANKQPDPPKPDPPKV